MAQTVDPQTQALAARLEPAITPLLMRRVYEAGTFTPFFGGNTTDGTFTYSVLIGKYIRIGNLCYINIVLAAATRPVAATGTRAQIKGLPFGSADDTGLTIGFTLNVSATGFHAQARSGATVDFHDLAGSVLPASVWLATSYVIVSGAYIIA